MSRLKVNSANDIPGWTHHWQHEHYPGLIKSLPPDSRMLEIGCGYGKSTWAWLDNLPKNFRLDILDNFSLEDIDGEPQKKYFFNTIKQHPNYSVIYNIIDSDYFRWKENNLVNYDLVYIDADHSFDMLLDQLEYFKDVPILCGDDYEYKHPGVVDAVDEFSKKYSREFELKTNFYIFSL
jgi:hypothetical protein